MCLAFSKTHVKISWHRRKALHSFHTLPKGKRQQRATYLRIKALENVSCFSPFFMFPSYLVHLQLEHMLHAHEQAWIQHRIYNEAFFIARYPGNLRPSGFTTYLQLIICLRINQEHMLNCCDSKIVDICLICVLKSNHFPNQLPKQDDIMK